MRRRTLAATGVAFLLILTGVNPGASAAGPYVTISDLGYDQVQAATAYNSQNDEFLTVWHNEWPGNKDIYGQRVNTSGTLTGAWLPISVGSGDRYSADVAYNDDRNEYLVVWEHDDFVRPNIRARRISAAGALLGSELTLGTGAALTNRFTPAVAYSTISEQYLVVWEAHTQGSNSTNIQAQVVTGVGALSGANFLIATGSGSESNDQPDVAFNFNRNEFLVVWRHYTTNYDIYARRVQGNGTPMNPSVIAVGNWANEEHSPRVAAVRTSVNFGKYMVVWQMEISAGNHNIYSRVVEGDGTPGTMIAAAFSADDETTPDVAGSAVTNTFMLGWTQPSGATSGVRQQQLTLANNLIGYAAWIDGNNADNCALATDGGGGFLVAYDSLPIPANGRDVLGWMSAVLFIDGFEFHNTNAWSTTFP